MTLEITVRAWDMHKIWRGKSGLWIQTPTRWLYLYIKQLKLNQSYQIKSGVNIQPLRLYSTGASLSETISKMIVAFVTCSIEIPCLKLSKETVEYIYILVSSYWLHQRVQKCYDRKLRFLLFLWKCVLFVARFFLFISIPFSCHFHTLSLSLDMSNLWSTYCLPLESPCVHPPGFCGVHASHCCSFLCYVLLCVVKMSFYQSKNMWSDIEFMFICSRGKQKYQFNMFDISVLIFVFCE
jgi:hypothetical protein